MNNNVLKLTITFLLLLLLFIPNISIAEETPLNISFSTIKTEAEAAAVGFLVKYAEQIDESFLSNADPKNVTAQGGWLLEYSPEIEIQTGDADSFNGLIAKITGNYISFSTTEIAGIKTPDSSKLFHVIPTSLGFESDRNFDNVSFLAEIGYVPFDLGSKYKIGLKSKIGFFLQAGYKFEANDQPSIKSGGAVDESEEKPDSEIARIKIDAGTEIKLIEFSKGNRHITLIPRVRQWYDLSNSESYHKYEAILKFELDKEKSFDLKYEDGSGAPNFNEGEQFSANITIKY